MLTGHFCLAMIIPEILLYVAAGVIFLVFSSVLFLGSAVNDLLYFIDSR